MAIIRIRLALPQAEYSALMQAAQQALRTPEAQAHYIVQQNLMQSGLLKAERNTIQSKDVLADG